MSVPQRWRNKRGYPFRIGVILFAWASLCTLPVHAQDPASTSAPATSTASTPPVAQTGPLTLELGEPLFFKLDPLVGEPSKLVLRVLCPNENVSRLEALVTHVRSPSGALATEPNIDAKVTRNNGPCSFDVSLLPSPKALSGVGEHTLSLRLSAYPSSDSPTSDAPAIVIKQVKIERPPVTLDLALPSVRLERFFPLFTTASGTLRASLRQAIPGNLHDCRATVAELVRAGADGSIRDRSYGSVSVAPDCSNGMLDVYFSSVDAVGSLSTTVTISAPALGDTPKALPLHVVVTDRPWGGLFAILAGVGLALGAQLLTESVRRRQVTSLRLARLTGRVERLLQRSQDGELLAQARALDESLEGLRRRIQVGDIPGVSEVDTAAKAISDQEAIVDKSITKPEEDVSIVRRARPHDGAYESTVEEREKVKLVVVDKAVRAGSEITLRLQPKDAPELENCTFRWQLGDARAPEPTKSPQLVWTFSRAGVKELKVSALRKGEEVGKYELRLPVAPSHAEEDIRTETRRLVITDATISVASALVAVIAAYSALYDPAVPFGTGKDYVTAFLWGFGFDSGMRGVLPVLRGLRKTDQQGGV